MEAYVKIIRQGNSLVVPLTKQLKALGLGEGDYVKLTIDLPIVQEVKVFEPTYDPSIIGDKVARTVAGGGWGESQIRSLISQYDGDREHIELILGYVMERITL